MMQLNRLIIGILRFAQNDISPHVILSPSAEPLVPSKVEGLRTGSAKDLVFQIMSHHYPNNEILRRFAPQNDINSQSKSNS
jgi:hypothetical protein